MISSSIRFRSALVLPAMMLALALTTAQQADAQDVSQGLERVAPTDLHLFIFRRTVECSGIQPAEPFAWMRAEVIRNTEGQRVPAVRSEALGALIIDRANWLNPQTISVVVLVYLYDGPYPPEAARCILHLPVRQQPSPTTVVS